MDKREKALTLAYRQVFSGETGSIVLADILNSLKFFSMQIKTTEDMALQNYARMLLSKLGAWQPHNMKRITDALKKLPYEDIKEKKKNGRSEQP